MLQQRLVSQTQLAKCGKQRSEWKKERSFCCWICCWEKRVTSWPQGSSVMPTCLPSLVSECVRETTIVICGIPESSTHKARDYLGAPRGLPSLLHKLPQLNTSYSLAVGPVAVYFHFASSDSPGTFDAIPHLSSVLSSPSISSGLLSASLPRCFRGSGPTCHSNLASVTSRRFDWRNVDRQVHKMTKNDSLVKNMGKPPRCTNRPQHKGFKYTFIHSYAISALSSSRTV